MAWTTRTVLVALTILVLAGPVAAQSQTTTTPTPDDEPDDEGGVTIIDLSGLKEMLEDFTSSWDETLEAALYAVFFQPFIDLLNAIVNLIMAMLLYTPDIQGVDHVEKIHRLTLMVAYALSGLAFIAAGLLYQVGPLFGVSYRQARMILPRLFVALVFATVSLPVLQYAVELTRTVSVAFAQFQLRHGLAEVLGVSSGLVLIGLVNAVLLLALALILVVRAVYIQFVAAISPLLAIMWSVPKARTFADPFISSWYAALLISPFDILVLRFSLAAFESAGNGVPFEPWLIGTGAVVLLLIVPWQLYGASQAVIGPAYMLAGQARSRVAGYQRRKRTEEYREKRLEQHQHRRQRRHGIGERPDPAPSGKFDKEVILDNDD